jgi:hypothetical protein
MQSFILKAASICELYVITERAISAVKNAYLVHLKEFRSHLQQVSIEFGNWTKWNEDESRPAAFSWIDKKQIHRVIINENLWMRYNKTQDQHEKDRIIFMAGMCTLHELGHLCIQWTHEKRYLFHRD